jgi:urea transporter
MIRRLHSLFPSLADSVLNSYTQVYFSNNRVFAVILMVVTFFDPWAGLSGLLSVIFANAVAYIVGFNRVNIRLGYYGFNSLLTGLGLGIFYHPGLQFFTLLAFTAVLSLFITLFFEGVIGKYGLPFLSMSFLFTIWLVTLASRHFSALIISERGIYSLNEMYSLGGLKMVGLYEWFNNIPLAYSLKIYFRSLGAILFQYHLLPGILVAAGLLIYSRIGFVLSLIGFYSAFYYYHFIGANFAELSYGYIGFNYILTAIAVGGFFIIPSVYSYIWVILLTPLISILLTSTNQLFSTFQLSVFSLPFNLTVLLFLYILKFREKFYSKPALVAYQQFSPEKNLYSQLNYSERFGNMANIPLILPFFGEWKVTQGHDGEITHQGDWRHAWDFELTGPDGKTYCGTGNQPGDYYCFGKPVVSPADGWIEEIVNDIEDNEIGRANVEQNWGNAVVIRHADHLYSKLCHLKKDSVKVTQGAFVRTGDILASCGNSGRSPVPHLHFQVQEYPYIGSKTIEYPLSNYIIRESNRFLLHAYGVPEKDISLSNTTNNTSMVKAFRFIPGEKLKFIVNRSDGKTGKVSWEVQSGLNDKPYIFCEQSGSRAYFTFRNHVLSFTHFEGDRASLLWYFYLNAYKVVTGFYKGLVIEDRLPLSIIKSGFLKYVQDVIAPFFIFLKPVYTMNFIREADDFTNSRIWLESLSMVKLGRFARKQVSARFEISSKGIDKIMIQDNKLFLEALRDEQD